MIDSTFGVSYRADVAGVRYLRSLVSTWVFVVGYARHARYSVLGFHWLSEALKTQAGNGTRLRSQRKKPGSGSLSLLNMFILFGYTVSLEWLIRFELKEREKTG